MISASYIPGKSIIHQSDPRIKLILLLLTVSLFFLPVSILAMSIYYFLIAALTIYSLGLNRLIQAMKMILPILIFVVILTPPFYRGGDSVFIIKNTVILSSEGISQTLKLILRFSGITVSFYLFFACTSINYFILTLEWFNLPYNAALIITIALRFIPSMIMSYTNIKDAHKLRDTNTVKSKLYARIKNIFPTLVSVLILAIKSIPSLSMALELRGIGLDTERSRYSVIISKNMVLQFILSGVIVSVVLIIAVFM